ncbi:methyltransferase domain-containing protein [Phreatobacter stygius]|uniref:Class I SAM-dependent methyltransferase n=1 Tax=Phreatobacter stygius TaxID=1940610 RepID=A0A4D7B4P6_9HYPH|nr:methyltransferase domain-containing protein [Phreatobacter stygius]QCI63172.1 class I SAM-dependent methyltransferase [Phreatobacter stygius]
MACLICASGAVREQLDVGCHPVSTFFLQESNAPERDFRLALGQCEDCGTIQSMEPVPHDALVPPYDWLFAREPEEHLDGVVEQILALPGVNTNSVIGALTSKDDTTVERFRRKGFLNTWRVKLDEDLGVANPAANIETVQKLTTPDRMATIAARRGAADVLIVRHIMEHAEDPRSFIQGIAALVKPGGIVMVEVPDCTTSLRLHDYCMLWEEHSLYLTPETFEPMLSIGGLEPIRTDVYQLPFENSLVQLARKTGTPGPIRKSPAARAQVGLLESYAQAYQPARHTLRASLERFRAERGPIALFGAGHLACAFANYMGVADLIDFVADDTPQKQGKFLPGGRLPILPSAALVDKGINLALLALSINNEDAVIARNEAFVHAGGTFRSIFRASPRSVFAGGL